MVTERSPQPWRVLRPGVRRVRDYSRQVPCTGSEINVEVPKYEITSDIEKRPSKYDTGRSQKSHSRLNAAASEPHARNTPWRNADY